MKADDKHSFSPNHHGGGSGGSGGSGGGKEKSGKRGRDRSRGAVADT